MGLRLEFPQELHQDLLQVFARLYIYLDGFVDRLDVLTAGFSALYSWCCASLSTNFREVASDL